MKSLPAWLPAPLLLDNFNGDWNAFNEAAYKIFVHDIKVSEISYESRKIVFDGRLSEGKEESFWHITSCKEDATNERLPDIRRTEKITWFRPVIENIIDPLISIWKELYYDKNKRRNKTRVFIWLESLEYLIVLEEKKDIYFLITAYSTDRKHTKKKLAKAREAYVRKSKGSP